MEAPIRAEVFGAERLEQHARSLAAADRITETPIRGRDLLPRVHDNGRIVLGAYHSIVAAVGAKREIALAEDWFLDNFHVVDQQLREIRDHLPRSYYRRLPKIAAGHLAGCPRVYGLAWAYVAHTDSRFEVETLGRFIRAYQRIQPLGIGELWAVLIHLRMALVENLRRLSEQVLHYLLTTEDEAVLDEEVTWLEGPTLNEGHQEAYFEPTESEDRATLYEHFARALDRSLEVGSHGLPLIGAGDWNDGMNRVGHEGRGESVWLGWFLLAHLREFARIADSRGEGERAAGWRGTAASLEASLDAEAWDGEWYTRAFFDNGTPLGSARNEECQIDSIPQSWAVISGTGDKQRARQAMESVEQRLVRRDDHLMLLFSPPFDRTPLDPGYIKGYVPGVRENGGQYTHAAAWSVVAFAMLGEGGKAAELFNLLSPIHHASGRANVYRYKVEPYVVAADVYSQRPHTGRGGWTWYTGAAGWLYRAGLERILGFRKHGSDLCIDPSIPREWQHFAITYCHGDALYRIIVENPTGVCRGVSRVSLDGTLLSGEALVPLSDDGSEHRVQVVLGKAVEAFSSRT